MPQFPDKKTFTEVLWDRIRIPELDLIPKNQRAAVEKEAKTRFIESLLNDARPEHAEFIMQQAMQDKYIPVLSIYDSVDHLYESVKTGKLVPYQSSSSAGLATGGLTFNALGIVDKDGKLKKAASGALEFDPHFSRRVVHETGHILDIHHPRGAFAFSEGSVAYIEARTQDRVHAFLMHQIHDTMERNGTHVLSAADKAALERDYQHIRQWYKGRMRAPNDGRTFMGQKSLPDTMEDYFRRLPEKNGTVSELMGQMLEKNPHLADDPLNAYTELLKKQYAEFGGITGDREFIRQLGTDVKDNVITRITEIGYYNRDQRVSESIAKAIDACNVNLNHAGETLPNGRNPLAALHIPNLEEHIETHVYEDLYRQNLQARRQLMPQYEEVWQRAGLNPQAQLRLQQEADAMRQRQGAQASEQQKDLQAQRRRQHREQKRLEQKRLEQQKLEQQQRLEQQQLEQQKLEQQQRLEQQQKLEQQQRLEQQKLEQQKLEQPPAPLEEAVMEQARPAEAVIEHNTGRVEAVIERSGASLERNGEQLVAALERGSSQTRGTFTRMIERQRGIGTTGLALIAGATLLGGVVYMMNQKKSQSQDQGQDQPQGNSNKSWANRVSESAASHLRTEASSPRLP